jgi:cell division protein FtsZ
MLIKPKAGQPAKIKVIGIGGAGGNVINSMLEDGGIPGVEFVAVNTDAQALLYNKAGIKIQIGENLTKGLGSGGNPDIGKQAAEESKEILKEEIGNADMIFISCGEGGGTGTGAAPIIADIARDTGALTVAVVTKPFDFEGSKRKFIADDGIQLLKNKVDTMIVVPNQRVLQIVDKKTPILEAFKKIDSVLHHGVRGIAELITIPGLINVDFADVKTIMTNAGTALMGIGIASGEKRALMAIKQAISSPLLDISIEGSKGVLFNIVGGPDLSMSEIDEAVSIIAKSVDHDADIIFGAVIDEKMLDQIKITLIATKFNEDKLRSFHFRREEEKPKEEESAPLNLRKEEKEEENVEENEDELFEEEYEEEDSEFDIPAFLRKK